LTEPAACDALIVGGGPAGSACARALRRAGLDVLVLDAAVFPRDKVCAGWITPQVVTSLGLDVEEYRRGRTFQPISGFHVGLIDGDAGTDTQYGRQVSFGIRRCEFDHYLLERSGARVEAGTPVTSLQRDGDHWVVNGRIRTPLLVGAGGHFCPVARHVNAEGRGQSAGAPVVVAQEAEFRVESTTTGGVQGEAPELYFCRDFKGYGWCFRKGEYLNIGLGRLDHRSLPRATAEFLEFLTATRRIPRDVIPRWRGHAYAVYETPHRRVVDSGVMLIGDAAALAYAQSGEGIRPAIESGLMAADAIVRANRDYSVRQLEPYADRLRARFGAGTVSNAIAKAVPESLGAALGRRLLSAPAFVRHVVLDRWFLHRQQPALS
jgi:flavin-dependent dehydrogenase